MQATYDLAKLPDEMTAAQREQLEWFIAEFEFKAKWCEENGYPSEAAMHRAHIRQTIRQICAYPG